jgi:hypothetical protein
VFENITKKGLKTLDSYYHMETQINETRSSIYREVKNIPKSELESTVPAGTSATRKKWTNWLRVIPFLKF